MTRGDIFKAVVGIAFTLVVVAGVLGWKFYAYGDCRSVGHSKPYCIVHFMSN